MTFVQMKNEVSLNIGGKVTDSTRLGLWVNWGYINLATYKDFEELDVVDDLDMVDEQTDYTEPTDLLGIITIEIWDETTTPYSRYRKLQRSKRKFIPQAEDSQPTHYKHDDGEIIVWPQPDQAYGGEIEYKKVPAVLATAAALSIFNASWDQAIVLLATHNGLVALGRQEEADRWLGRALGYISSRKTNLDVGADQPKGGLNIAWTRDEISEDPADVGG